MAAKRNNASDKRSRPAGGASAQDARSDTSLSLERIVAAAVDLLDAEGLDGLKMRRLADHLGAGAMSLYWHVASKEEVLDLALDSVLEYQPNPHEQARDWRVEVVHLLEDWRSRMLRHPWSATLLPRRALGPNILGRLERLGRILSGAGVPDAELNVAIWSLWNYVIGATVTRASFGLSDEEMATAQKRLSGLADLYPTIERSQLPLDSDWDGTFLKGLDILLGGLADRAGKQPANR